MKSMPERDQWGRHIEFLLTLIGYAVGLGNVWRFPYLCYKNGGGAFLIPYVLCLIFIGLPLFALEIAFGQFGGKGPISIWYINPALKGVGLAGVMISAVISIYYNVIIAWGLYYFLASFTDEVPWDESQCNDCACLTFGKKVNSSSLNCTGWNGKPKSASEVYFTKNVLEVSDGIEDTGNIKWEIMLCNLLAWLIVFGVLSKGIKSLGKVVYFTTIFPYLLLTILLIRTSMLEGASIGIEYYLKPDFSRLSDPTVWSDAAIQIFFSLSTCQGGLIAMASYNKFTNNVMRDGLIVPIINCFTSFYAGFVVFSTLGYMAHLRGVDVSKVTVSGAGLAFVAYPEALANMPITPLWSILFFMMLCTLGFSSQFSIVETVMTAVIDEFPRMFTTNKKRMLFRIGVCVGGFILGFPMVTQSGVHWLEFLDSSIVGFPTLFNGLFELIALAWIYGYTEFAKDIETMIGRKPFIYFRICWSVVSPLLISVIIVAKCLEFKSIYSQIWADVLWWIITMVPTVLVFLRFIYYTFSRGVFKECQRINKPLPSWKQRRLMANPLTTDVTEIEPSPYSKNNVSQDNLASVSSKDPNEHAHENMGYNNDGDQTGFTLPELP